MAWVVPTTYSTGSIVTASAWNGLAGNETVLETYIGLFNAGGALVGSPPATGSAPTFQVQAGTSAATTNSSGVYTCAYGATFTSAGLLTAIIQPADTNFAPMILDLNKLTTNAAHFTATAWSGNTTYLNGYPGFASGSIPYQWSTVGTGTVNTNWLVVGF